MIYLIILNILAQVCNIVGAYLLFKYSLPPHINKFSGSFIGVSELDFLKEDSDNKKYAKNTKLGFLLVLIGFSLSLPINLSALFCS
jgi:hypothetical protein